MKKNEKKTGDELLLLNDLLQGRMVQTKPFY
jgi:hypothetical protein